MKRLPPQFEDLFLRNPELRNRASELYPDLISPEESPEMLEAEENVEPEVGQAAFEQLEQNPFMTEEIQAAAEAPEMQEAETAEEAPEMQDQVAQMEQMIARNPAVNIQEMLAKQAEEQDKLDLLRASAKARNTMLGIKDGDMTVYDSLQRKIERPIKQLQLQQELEQDQAKNNPNSQISILARNSLAELGMDMSNYGEISFSQIEKLYPTLAQSLYTRVAAQARIAEAKIEAAARKAATIQKMEKDKQDRELKQQQLEQQRTENELNRKLKRDENQLRRELQEESRNLNQENKQFSRDVQTHKVVEGAVDKLRKSDGYNLYKGSKEADALLEAAIQAPNNEYKTMAAAAFMRYAKTAQGDQSVVRNEDMKVLTGGLNLTDIYGKIESKTKGSDLSPKELAAMQKVMRKIQDIKKQDM
jgi:hypothetical protein